MTPTSSPAHPKLRAYSDALIVAFVVVVASLAFSFVALAVTGTATDFLPMEFGNAADQGQEAPVTQATTWHGAPGNTGGFSDQAKGAAPATAGNAGGDGGIHGIANNPGQSGIAPADQANGNPSCNMHGGFNGVKSQCGG